MRGFFRLSAYLFFTLLCLFTFFRITVYSAENEVRKNIISMLAHKHDDNVFIVKFKPDVAKSKAKKLEKEKVYGGKILGLEKKVPVWVKGTVLEDFAFIEVKSEEDLEEKVFVKQERPDILKRMS